MIPAVCTRMRQGCEETAALAWLDSAAGVLQDIPVVPLATQSAMSGRLSRLHFDRSLRWLMSDDHCHTGMLELEVKGLTGMQAHWRAYSTRRQLQQRWKDQLRAALQNTTDAQSRLQPSAPAIVLFCRTYNPRDTQQLGALAQVCQMVTQTQHASGQTMFMQHTGEELAHAMLHAQRLCQACLDTLVVQRCAPVTCHMCGCMHGTRQYM